ncbi:MAG: pyridoxamine 5'-phosphate oxidase [Bacteroidetes bacterium]|nr:pyridoxamine 5'-phosphate oxidase [Bacteroidia bacterium]PCH69536.1 MAG: pyridoxamine 5'-phosphate oxidase [Bacteroidota bacterium]
MKENLRDIDSEYFDKSLNESNVSSNPFEQFGKWFDDALKDSILPFANAMTLSTATKDGRPSARMVLLKDFGHEGFVFYTNYESKKAKELFENPFAALTFYWPALQRQVRVSGQVEKTTEAESDEYFNSRPRGSQIAASVSPQSNVVERSELDKSYEELDSKFADMDIPRPDFWGGFRLIPDIFEFWQGRPNRFHDRISYSLNSGTWTIERLAP